MGRTWFTDLPVSPRVQAFAMGNFVKVIFAIVIIYTAWNFMTKDAARPAGANPEIIVYTTTACGYCERARAYINEQGIAYVEKNTDHSSEYRRELRELGAGGVPFFLIDGKPHSGFERTSFERALRDRS